MVNRKSPKKSPTRKQGEERKQRAVQNEKSVSKTNVDKKSSSEKLQKTLCDKAEVIFFHEHLSDIKKYILGFTTENRRKGLELSCSPGGLYFLKYILKMIYSLFLYKFTTFKMKLGIMIPSKWRLGLLHTITLPAKSKMTDRVR